MSSVSSVSSGADDGPIIIKFKRHGQGNPDMRIKVFGIYEYHVHSAVLKMNSPFFGNFLDSADKTPASPTADFKYEWESKMDPVSTYGGGENDRWSIVAIKGGDAEVEQVVSSADKDKDFDSYLQAKLFRIILDVLYGHPIRRYRILIGNIPDLTRLADYYRCLPALSAVVDRVVVEQWRNEDVISQPPLIIRLFKSAVKLRNYTLLQQTLLNGINPWNRPVFTDFERHRIYMNYDESAARKLIEMARHQVEKRLVDIQGQIVNHQRHPKFCQFLVEVSAKATEWYDNDIHINGPGILPLRIYYQKMYETLRTSPLLKSINVWELERSLGELLENNLRLNQRAEMSEEDNLTTSFTCVNLEALVLPWDEEEVF